MPSKGPFLIRTARSRDRERAARVSARSVPPLPPYPPRAATHTHRGCISSREEQRRCASHAHELKAARSRLVSLDLSPSIGLPSSFVSSLLFSVPSRAPSPSNVPLLIPPLVSSLYTSRSRCTYTRRDAFFNPLTPLAPSRFLSLYPAPLPRLSSRLAPRCPLVIILRENSGLPLVLHPLPLPLSNKCAVFSVLRSGAQSSRRTSRRGGH